MARAGACALRADRAQRGALDRRSLADVPWWCGRARHAGRRLELAAELRYPGYGLSDDTKQFLRGRLQMARSKERRTYDTEVRTAVYGAEHPYARPSLSESSLDEISRDDIMSWARGHIVGNNATLVLAGRFDVELVKKHIAYNADHVKAGKDSPDPVTPPRSTRAYVRGLTQKPRPTVELAVHFTAGRGIDRDHAKRLVLTSVLDSRLSVLRGDRAVTYGFSASYAPRRGGGLWTIGGDADAQRAEEAAAGLVTILHELRTDPESYRSAFVLARQKVLENLLATNNSSATIASRLAQLARFDLPDDHHGRLAAEVAGLTLARFHEFVVRELSEQGQVFGAFGNRLATEAALTRAKTTAAELAVTPVTPVTPARGSEIVDPFAN